MAFITVSLYEHNEWEHHGPPAEEHMFTRAQDAEDYIRSLAERLFAAVDDEGFDLPPEFVLVCSIEQLEDDPLEDIRPDDFER